MTFTIQILAACFAFLLQIAQGEPGAVLSLKKKLTEISVQKSPARSRSTRTVGELFERAEKIKEAAERKARDEADRKRILRLEELAGNEEVNWQYLEKLLQQKLASLDSKHGTASPN